jgi:hypothetical protein
MGHRHTRVVERVYGRLSPEEMGTFLTAHFAPDCIACASRRPKACVTNVVGVITRAAYDILSKPRAAYRARSAVPNPQTFRIGGGFLRSITSRPHCA